jgi:SAM-dependent methyltransferase
VIEDVIYKLGRKALPSGAYSALSKSPLGRVRSWRKIETYSAAFEFFRKHQGGFAGQRVMEIGCGNQFFTALFFLKAGAAQVLLVDPTIRMDLREFEAEFRFFKDRFSWDKSFPEVSDKVICFQDFSQVPSEFDGKVDQVLSYLSLEHFHELESFFLHCRRTLKAGGSSCNLVDLSDHTYHLLGRYRVLRALAHRRILYHLRYSHGMFRILNDPKCYMNRVLLPAYFKLADQYGLAISIPDKVVDADAVVHPDLLREFPSADPSVHKTVNFVLKLEKRAG